MPEKLNFIFQIALRLEGWQATWLCRKCIWGDGCCVKQRSEARGTSERAAAEFVAQGGATLRHGCDFLTAKSLLLAICHPSLVPGTPRDSMGAPELFY